MSFSFKTYYKLYIFVEGYDDELFFKHIIITKVKNLENYKNAEIKIIQYAQKPNNYIINYIKSIKSMNHTDYIFVADMDNETCITQKKQETIKKYENNVDFDKIIIVKKEIESWYLAGLDNNSLNKLKIKENFDKTDNIGKGKFNNLKPSKFISLSDFKEEILKHFNIDVAKQKNSSFNYFAKKYNL